MTILDEAAELINGQRAQDYGDVADNFGRIASLWSSFRGQYFSKHDVAVFMILVKVARQHDLYHRDSMVDIAGYAALDAKIYDDLDQPGYAAPMQPRVWKSLADVPAGVRVLGFDDEPDEEPWIGEDTTEYDYCGPFTEVLTLADGTTPEAHRGHGCSVDPGLGEDAK